MPGIDTRGAPELLAELADVGRRPATQVARDVAAALGRASETETPEADATRLDEAAVGVLAQSRNADALTAELPIEALERVVERSIARAGRTRTDDADTARRLAWSVLDVLRRPPLLGRLAAADCAGWSRRILRLVEDSDFTVGPLFRERAALYAPKTLFEIDAEGRRESWSWERVASHVELYGRALLSLDGCSTPAPVAILSENRIEMALLDLACLTSGIVNVMVPANATEKDVGYILRHSGAGTVIVSGSPQLAKVLPHRESLPRLRTIVTLTPDAARASGALTLDALAARAEGVPRGAPRERSEAVGIEELATVMYTSGTTGMPKGIQFSHRNVVFKRFARALALPEIGDRDVFLCFLPLFHTFGRFLEMLGCVFWGAKYCFLENPSVTALVRGMQRQRPTVFISVPKKWMQLHEMIARDADPVEATDEELLAATRGITGGRLRWGLSAAGHLDSDIFRFFQHQGVELMSGFGMTEATGGITMTPPGAYEDHSLGGALPGIETRLAADGELLVRGPYVMMGYLDPPDGAASFDADGWLHTGDLMEITANGHLRLVDRKKEIYKNIKGETIAPQRVENLFREFESVGRAFLVGDHRDYNTLLIYPNPETTRPDLRSMSSAEVHEHFRSLVVSVNQFLAPYERVVDFAVIDRDLEAERGELTPKGTPRRKVVEQNFSGTVRELYRRTSVRVGGLDVLIPNWLFQLLGLTAQDIRFGEAAITLPSSGTQLAVKSLGDGLALVGSCHYRHRDGPLDLGALLSAPRLWLGNEQAVAFAPLDTVTRQRSGRGHERLEWAGREHPYTPREDEHQMLESFLGRDDLDVLDLDLAARMLASPHEVDALLAVRVLEEILDRAEGPLAEPARLLLSRAATASRVDVRRRAFQVLIPAEKDARVRDVLERFAAHTPDLFDAETRLTLSEATLSEEKLQAFIDATQHACAADDPQGEASRAAGGLLGFLASYGAAHPTGYKRIRAFLQRMAQFASRRDARMEARRTAVEMTVGFREWLGPTARVAVDPDRGEEYRWEDVVVFDEPVPAADRRRLLSAIRQTAFLREAVFLFSPGVSFRLSDVVPGGVRVRLLGRLHGKSVYRISVQTRFQGAFDVAVNVNHDLPTDRVQEEIRWLVLSGDPAEPRGRLVEDFGGYWPEQDLWSEEFIAGETLEQAMRRLAALPDREERLQRMWPFMAWATLSAYVDFWHRSGRRLEIADPDMRNIVVPNVDFVEGVRIVSLSRRRPHRGIAAMLRGFREEFLQQAEELYPTLGGDIGWSVVFSSVLEVVGEIDGLALLRDVLDRSNGADDELASALGDYIETVDERGFMPMRLYFAVERYRRWARLSSDATPQARALTLREMFETYGLQRLAATYPEIRVRFYRETVFRHCSESLAQGLTRIIRSIRDGELQAEELVGPIDALRAQQDLNPDDEYFLARLSYPHLRPQDAAGFVRRDSGGRRMSDIVVTLEDAEGNPFRVRHALNPKEVERLLQLFLAAKLDVRFRMEHQYLVAINERSHIVGGIYYEIEEEGRSAHLEKIVVAERYRAKRVAHALMAEFFNRLRSAGVKTVTTGFFRPDYFDRYGFRVEKRFAGLVKKLTEDDPPSRER